MVLAWMLFLSLRLFAVSVRPHFGGTALSGLPVSSYQLERKERTLLFVWATWCGYCRSEMPDIASLSRKYPSIQVIGICTDLADRTGAIDSRKKKSAERIMRQAGLDVLTIAPSPSLSSFLLDDLPGIPAAFWVDGNGEILSGPILGMQKKEELARQFEAMK